MTDAGWRRLWAWGRYGAGAAVLALVLWRVGTGPFLSGLTSIGGWSLVVAVGITAVTTVCAAWRWCLVARSLGVAIPLRSAISAYYQSQFLNSVLPGGILGDVERAVRHGKRAGDVGRGLRAVAWERWAGQVAHLSCTLVALVVLPLALPGVGVLVVAVVVVALGGAVLLRVRPPQGGSWAARVWRAIRSDIRQGVLGRRALPGVAVASVLVVAGHAATFVVAARSAGIGSSVPLLLPLAMLALGAMVVPMNIGGWGPREGVAAWSFGVVGLGADQGLATAAAYGLLACAATLPGAALFVVTRLRGPLRALHRS